jgi:hypothetical protein
VVHVSNNRRWTGFPADSVFPIAAIDAALAVDAPIGIDHCQIRRHFYGTGRTDTFAEFTSGAFFLINLS